VEIRRGSGAPGALSGLVAIAANDIMTPPQAGRSGRLIAGSRTVTIADCGHMLVAEAPDAVLDA